MKRFLIGQLGAFGDCLYATTIAKQIKFDYPNSHITWAVASKYKSILELNPYVDQIWEIPVLNNDYSTEGWTTFEEEAKERRAQGIYDQLIFSQITKTNWANYDGTIRSSTLRSYKKPITVGIDPVIRLNKSEVENVFHFAERHNLSSFKEVVLFECSPTSGQSFLTLDIALTITERILSFHKEVCFIISSNKILNVNNPRIIDGSELTFRENAELTKYCTLLIGCSSGITWLSTSDWAKRLNTVQLLDKNYAIFAGVRYDFQFWNLPSESIIEIVENDIEYIGKCIDHILAENFESAKKRFNHIYVPTYYNLRQVLRILLWETHNSFKVFTVVSNYHKRNKHFNFFILLYYGILEIIRFHKSRFLIFFKKNIDRFKILNV